MKRVKIIVAYDGTAYHGWQIQNNANTIEAELNKHLSALLCEPITVIGASRTDSGVHALCNVAVFDTNTRMPGEKIAYALNQRLPEDIRIVTSTETDLDFHPRRCESIKTYEYRIYNAEFPMPTRRLYSHFTHVPLNADLMAEAAAYLEGRHDFKSFCAADADSGIESTVRTIYQIYVEQTGNEIVIHVSGNGFLYHMVRIIAGTLMEVGQKKYPPQFMRSILEARDRSAAGPTAPARGLTLTNYVFR